MELFADMQGPDLSTFWQKIANSEQGLSGSDMQHINACAQCQHSFLEMLSHHHFKVTPEIMAAITADDFKQEVIRTLCLRAVAAGVGN